MKLPRLLAVRTICLSILLFAPVATTMAESTWSDPHPMRLESITEGRLFTYNPESFLHRFSYRNLSDEPRPGQDGLWGTGGSVTGDQLYVEINGQKTFRFDNERYAVIARMQRREDFDGRFDRQLVGVSRRFGSSWEAAFVADITGDKGLVDFQLEAGWRPDATRELRLALIQPDRLYNNKSNSNNKYHKAPTTAFLHYRQELAGHAGFEVAVNATPRARYEDRAVGYTVDAEQLRLMGNGQLPLAADWYGGARLELENTRRDLSGPAVPGGDFRRKSRHVTVSASAPERSLNPSVGLRYFRLDESGWFGTGLAVSGRNQREEIGAFASMTWRSGDQHWFEPAVFLGHVDLDRRFLESPERDRQSSEVVGKLILPWRYVVHQESGAVVTLNPTFRLHRFAFGGGNIQLHWPL